MVTFIFTVAVFLVLCVQESASAGSASRQPKTEAVMTPGMIITATTKTGTITITAVDELTRSYTWEGATRSVEMEARDERWYGSLGLYFPGPGDHWKPHNGITRGVLEEGQQHFKTTQEAMDWIHARKWMPFVFRGDGLVVGWDKIPERRQLSVEVWQILVGGKKPQGLPGSDDSKIRVTQKAPGRTPDARLITAVQLGSAQLVNSLLAEGANPNSKNSAGTPILLTAIRGGHLAVVQALLAKGANPNGRNEEGGTALITAVESQHADIVRSLLSHKAAVNSAYDRGMGKGTTPLIIAAVNGDSQIASILLDAGADIHASDSMLGMQAIHWAASEGSTAIVEMLLRKGSNVDSRKWSGQTPLMEAALAGHTDVVKLLISQGANVNARDDFTRRLYGAAQFGGDTVTERELERSGGLKNLHEDGDSVLDSANLGGNAEIIALIQKAGAKR